MALLIGRQGYLGLGIESTPGTAVASTTTIPFVNNTLGGKHQPVQDIAARGSRSQDFTSVVGKQWSEGEVDVNVDVLNIGYLLKLATGNEALSTVVASQVFDHLFYTSVSGNTPLTATLYNYQGVDVQKFPSSTVDKFDLEVKDSLMTAKVGFKGFFPTTGAHTNTTVSGTLISFNDYSAQLGSSLTVAAAASVSPLTDFMLSVKNNAEVVFESGNATASRIFWKQQDVSGSFTRFFETVTDRDNYLNMNKQSMIITCSGNALPGGNYEMLKINLAKLVYTDTSISTGLENFFAVKTNFTAEVDVLQGKQYDFVLRNYKSTVYA